MKKRIFGRQFKRDANERKALFKGLMSSLVLHERIETTEAKAKAVRGSVEKLVTKAKKLGIKAKPQMMSLLHDDAIMHLVSHIAPRFSARPGGYTRIIKTGRRFGDNAPVVVMEWVDKEIKDEKAKVKTATEKKIESEGSTLNSSVTGKKNDTKITKKKTEVKKQAVESKKSAKKTVKKEKSK